MSFTTHPEDPYPLYLAAVDGQLLRPARSLAHTSLAELAEPAAPTRAQPTAGQRLLQLAPSPLHALARQHATDLLPAAFLFLASALGAVPAPVLFAAVTKVPTFSTLPALPTLAFLLALFAAVACQLAGALDVTGQLPFGRVLAWTAAGELGPAGLATEVERRCSSKHEAEDVQLSRVAK